MAKLRLPKKETPPDEGVPSKELVGYTGDHINVPRKADMDARDIVSSFVGGGHTSLNTKDLRDSYKRLSDLVGVPMAQKLSNQAFLHNQRTDTKKMNPQQKVQSFFDIGSNDPEVNNAIRNYRGLAQGQSLGFRTSPLLGNRGLLGNSILPASPEVASTDGGAEQKIKLLLRQNGK